MKLMVTTLFLFVLVTPWAHPLNAAEARSDGQNKEAVAEVVRSAVDGVLSILREGGLSQKEKRARVMRVIDPVIDFSLMAKLTLGKRWWKKITPAQRESFTDLFIQDLKRSYFEKLTLFSDETVEYGAPERQPSRNETASPKYSVLTYVLSKGERLQVTYLLALRPPAPTPASGSTKAGAVKGTASEGDDLEENAVGRDSEVGRVWRVYDLEIEGVSILESKRTDYHDFLREKSFEDLLAELRKKIEAARAKDAEADKERRN